MCLWTSQQFFGPCRCLFSGVGRSIRNCLENDCFSSLWTRIYLPSFNYRSTEAVVSFMTYIYHEVYCLFGQSCLRVVQCKWCKISLNFMLAIATRPFLKRCITTFFLVFLNWNFLRWKFWIFNIEESNYILHEKVLLLQILSKWN